VRRDQIGVDAEQFGLGFVRVCDDGSCDVGR
jgi:hypothetical protein